MNQAIQLRPYQGASLNGVREQWQSKTDTGEAIRRVILCAPTGAGKTVMFSAMVEQALAKSFTKKVLILTDRKELLTQAGGTLEKFGIRFEPIMAGKKNEKINTRARCYVAMVQTFINRAKECPWLLDVDLVIIDECHKGNFKRLFSLFRPGTFVIGATATPIASDKKDPLSNYYQALVNRVQIPELVDAGFLSPCITFAPKIDRSALSLSMGDYSEESQYQTFAKRSVYDNLLTHYQNACDKYNDGKPMRTVCFNVNVAHSLQVTAMLNAAGISAKHIDGTTPEELRTATIQAYQNGEFSVLCNVGILNAGFDDPETSCIIFNRATASVSLWLQSCGRGSRIAAGKSRFVILDMGNNWMELGLWDSVRDWDTLWNKPWRKRDTVGVAPAKECDECGAIVHLSARICPHCEHEFPVKAKELATAETFVEVTPDMVPAVKEPTENVKVLLGMHHTERRPLLQTLPVVDLLEFQENKGYKLGWLTRLIAERATDEFDYRDQIEELANLKGYKRGWVARQLEDYYNANQMAEV